MNEDISFIKRLAFLITAGSTVSEALHMIAEQSSGETRAHIERVAEDVRNGSTLSESLSAHKQGRKSWSEFAIQLIMIGETSGTLAGSLTYLAQELAKGRALKKKIIGAFIYPAIVVLATCGIVAFLMIYLFPKITPVFTSLHLKLPWSTRLLMAVSTEISHQGFYILAIVALFITASIILFQKSSAVRNIFDTVTLRMPIVGTALQHYALANVTRTLGTLLASGSPLSEALPIAARVTESIPYRTALESAGKHVERGENFSESLKASPRLFPVMMRQITEVGERTGTLAESFVYLSNMYETEVEDFTKNLSTVVEPVLMVIMGLVVGFIAVSIITPIYGITQNLHA